MIIVNNAPQSALSHWFAFGCIGSFAAGDACFRVMPVQYGEQSSKVSNRTDGRWSLDLTGTGSVCSRLLVQAHLPGRRT